MQHKKNILVTLNEVSKYHLYCPYIVAKFILNHMDAKSIHKMVFPTIWPLDGCEWPLDSHGHGTWFVFKVNRPYVSCEKWCTL